MVKLHPSVLFATFLFLGSCCDILKNSYLSNGLGANESLGVAELRSTSPLCRSFERTLYDCQVGETRIAVCGPEEVDGMPGPAIYREVGPGVPIIQIPEPSISQHQRPTIARTMYSGGGEVQFRFSANATDYIAYSRTIRTGPDELGRWVPEHQAGIAHYTAGRFNGIRHCTPEGGLQVPNEASLDAYFDPGEFVYVQLEED